MKFVLGITGGIGSGKTTVSDRFASHGIVVADADLAAREVVMPGTSVWKQIRSRFGDEILFDNLSLNRSALRKIIFQDANERRWLESITHPAIVQLCKEQIEASESAYAILVLSAGTGKSTMMNRLLVVDVSEENQIKRVMARDSNTEDQVKAIIAAQSSRQDRLAQADDIIENSGKLEDLYEKVDHLHLEYIKMANRWAETENEI